MKDKSSRMNTIFSPFLNEDDENIGVNFSLFDETDDSDTEDVSIKSSNQFKPLNREIGVATDILKGYALGSTSVLSNMLDPELLFKSLKLDKTILDIPAIRYSYDALKSISGELKYSANYWAKTMDKETWIGGIGSGLGSVAGFVLPSLFLRMPVSGGVALFESYVEAVDTYNKQKEALIEKTKQEAIKKQKLGISPEVVDESVIDDVAVGSALKTFFGNLPLNYVTNKLGAFSEKARVISKGILAPTMEGIQEMSQFLIQHYSIEPDDRDKLLMEDILFEGAIGAIVGKAVDVILPTAEFALDRIDTILKNMPKEFVDYYENAYNELVNSGYTEKEAYRIALDGLLSTHIGREYTKELFGALSVGLQSDLIIADALNTALDDVLPAEERVKYLNELRNGNKVFIKFEKYNEFSDVVITDMKVEDIKTDEGKIKFLENFNNKKYPVRFVVDKEVYENIENISKDKLYEILKNKELVDILKKEKKIFKLEDGNIASFGNDEIKVFDGKEALKDRKRFIKKLIQSDKPIEMLKKYYNSSYNLSELQKQMLHNIRLDNVGFRDKENVTNIQNLIKEISKLKEEEIKEYSPLLYTIAERVYQGEKDWNKFKYRVKKYINNVWNEKLEPIFKEKFNILKNERGSIPIEGQYKTSLSKLTLEKLGIEKDLVAQRAVEFLYQFDEIKIKLKSKEDLAEILTNLVLEDIKVLLLKTKREKPAVISESNLSNLFFNYNANIEINKKLIEYYSPFYTALLDHYYHNKKSMDDNIDVKINEFSKYVLFLFNLPEIRIAFDKKGTIIPEKAEKSDFDNIPNVPFNRESLLRFIDNYNKLMTNENIITDYAIFLNREAEKVNTSIEMYGITNKNRFKIEIFKPDISVYKERWVKVNKYFSMFDIPKTIDSNEVFDDLYRDRDVLILKDNGEVVFISFLEKDGNKYDLLNYSFVSKKYLDDKSGDYFKEIVEISKLLSGEAELRHSYSDIVMSSHLRKIRTNLHNEVYKTFDDLFIDLFNVFDNRRELRNIYMENRNKIFLDFVVENNNILLNFDYFQKNINKVLDKLFDNNVIFRIKDKTYDYNEFKFLLGQKGVVKAFYMFNNNFQNDFYNDLKNRLKEYSDKIMNVVIVANNMLKREKKVLKIDSKLLNLLALRTFVLRFENDIKYIEIESSENQQLEISHLNLSASSLFGFKANDVDIVVDKMNIFYDGNLKNDVSIHLKDIKNIRITNETNGPKPFNGYIKLNKDVIDTKFHEISSSVTGRLQFISDGTQTYNFYSKKNDAKNLKIEITKTDEASIEINSELPVIYKYQIHKGDVPLFIKTKAPSLDIYVSNRFKDKYNKTVFTAVILNEIKKYSYQPVTVFFNNANFINTVNSIIATTSVNNIKTYPSIKTVSLDALLNQKTDILTKGLNEYNITDKHAIAVALNPQNKELIDRIIKEETKKEEMKTSLSEQILIGWLLNKKGFNDFLTWKNEMKKIFYNIDDAALNKHYKDLNKILENEHKILPVIFKNINEKLPHLRAVYEEMLNSLLFKKQGKKIPGVDEIQINQIDKILEHLHNLEAYYNKIINQATRETLLPKEYINDINNILSTIDFKNKDTVQKGAVELVRYIEQKGLPTGITLKEINTLRLLDDIKYEYLNQKAKSEIKTILKNIFRVVNFSKFGKIGHEKPDPKFTDKLKELVWSVDTNLKYILDVPYKDLSVKDKLKRRQLELDLMFMHTSRVADMFDGFSDYTGKHVSLIKDISKTEIKIKEKVNNIILGLLEKIEKDLNIKEISNEMQARITYHLALAQGAVKQAEKLRDVYKEFDFDKLLTKEEAYIIEKMRSEFKVLLPEVEKVFVARNKTEFKPIDNYFPLVYVDEDIHITSEELLFRIPTTTTEAYKGFTFHRQKNVNKELRIDIFRVFQEVLYAEYWYSYMQPKIDEINSLISHPLYIKEAGYGIHNWWKEYLDILARKGTSSASLLSTYRHYLKKHRLKINSAVLSFKLSVILLQPLAVAQTIAYTIQRYGINKGMMSLLYTISHWINIKKAREYIKTSGALKVRQAGEIAIAEGSDIIKSIEELSLYEKAKSKIIKLGFDMITFPDIITASGAQKFFEDFITDGNKEDAEFLMNLVSGSTEIALRPLILGKGEGWRTLLTFSGFALNAWGILYHDVLRGAIGRGNHKRKLLGLLALSFLILSGEAEDKIREFCRVIFVMDKKDRIKAIKEDYDNEHVLQTILLYIPRQIPVFGSSVEKVGRLEYPILKYIRKFGTGLYDLGAGDFEKGLLDIIESGLVLGVGMPATTQVMEIIRSRKEAKKKPKKKKVQSIYH